MVSEENRVADSEQIVSFIGRIQCSCCCREPGITGHRLFASEQRAAP